ncbi:MAG: hypothetical protein K2M78_11970 [Lachnospiraceae bacterium]|nr:hypothetical protein [Lachnospiraceae bacterium]
MIMNTKQAAVTLSKLPIEKKLIAVDEKDNEYIIDSVMQRKLYTDEENDWCYALKIRKAGGGCIKR